MATLSPSAGLQALRGKVGGLIFSEQVNGTVTVRGVGKQKAPSTPGEKKGQNRMKLAQPFIRWILGSPDLRLPYALEAERRNMRIRDLIMADFLTDPVILAVDATRYTGAPGDLIFVVTPDDFKVVRVGLVFRNAQGERIQDGLAQPAWGQCGGVWMYKGERQIPADQLATVDVVATDRAGHSAVKTQALGT